MQMIKLTNATNDGVVHLGIENLVAFWEEDGKTVIITKGDGKIFVKETPSKIEETIDYIKILNTMILTQRMY